MFSTIKIKCHATMYIATHNKTPNCKGHQQTLFVNEWMKNDATMSLLIDELKIL